MSTDESSTDTEVTSGTTDTATTTAGSAGEQYGQATESTSGTRRDDKSRTRESEDSGESDRKFTQAELDRKVEDRLARERRKFSDYDEVKQGKATAEQKAEDAETQRQELLNGIASALGLKKEDTPPDPAALQQTIESQQGKITELESRLGEHQSGQDARVWERDLELAAWRAASRHEANVPGLMDSRAFISRIGRIEPGSASLDVDMDEAVKAHLAEFPTLRANTVADPAKAGIGARGLSGAAAAAPGFDRAVAAYSSTTK